MSSPSHRPLVLIPSYNTGPRLAQTVGEALSACEAPVLVVIDGSSDDSEMQLRQRLPDHPRLEILSSARNEGKGAAVRRGLMVAQKRGFTHALAMDADGQHPSQEIERFLLASRQRPDAMILGQPIFDASVPLERLHGRKLSVWLAQFETLSKAVGDPLFGFRVYPIEPLLKVMAVAWRSNRYDFDPEVAIRLTWAGVPSVKLFAPVRYLSKEEGGVSHFHYIRDNVRFVWLHTRLLLEALIRFPQMLIRRNRPSASEVAT